MAKKMPERLLQRIMFEARHPYGGYWLRVGIVSAIRRAYKEGQLAAMKTRKLK